MTLSVLVSPMCVSLWISLLLFAALQAVETNVKLEANSELLRRVHKQVSLFLVAPLNMSVAQSSSVCPFD